jgi:hypothetical protein
MQVLQLRPMRRERAPRVHALLWYLWQCAELSERLSQHYLGESANSIVRNYESAWVDRDIIAGLASVGSTMLDSDAAWRSRYIDLGKGWLAVGDRRKAAVFAKAAYDTLQPTTWTHSADRYTLTGRAPIADEFLLPTATGASLDAS